MHSRAAGAILDDVAPARVEQAVIPAARAGPEVALLDEEAAQAAAGQVADDAGPGRAAADDEDVDGLDGRHGSSGDGVLGVHAAAVSESLRLPAQAGTGSRASDSTQSKVRVTAFFQSLYSRSRVASSIDGVHSLSFAQFARRSSTAFQNPTARPAA